MVNDHHAKHDANIGGRLYAVPALLMCAITLAMLAADLFAPGMNDRQYMLYPMLYRIQMLLAAACCLVCLMRDGIEIRRPGAAAMFFAGFALWAAVSTCINGFGRDALFGVQYRYIGVIDLLVFMGVYMYCSGRTGSGAGGGAGRHLILLGMVVIADLIDIAVLYDSLIAPVEPFRGKNGLSAIFYHGNHFGYFLVMAALISAGYFIYGSARQMLIAVPSMLLDLFMLAVNGSLGCLIAAASVLLLMAVVSLACRRGGRARSVVMLCLMAAGAAAALIASEGLRADLWYTVREAGAILQGRGTGVMGHGRWELWDLTAGYIKERPLFGHGCEGIAERLMADSPEINKVANPHCEPLTYAAFFGIPAAVLYVAGCVGSIIRGMRNDGQDVCRPISAYAAAGYFISSLFGVEMFYTAPFFFVLLGISSAGDEGWIEKRVPACARYRIIQ